VAIRPLTQTALAGIAAESERFERSAARVTRLAGAPSAAETAETVQISPEARELSQNLDAVMTSGLEGAMVDMRVAKYAFIANLKVLQTGAEVEKAAAELLKK
jgi:flagellar basal body rod protein FlgC